MKNLIGKCKSLIACAIAFAVVAVSLFTGVFVTASAETVGTCGRTIVEKWDNISDGVRVDWYDASFDGKGDGTKDNPYIITSAEELANLCRYGSNAGVYYKVDDNIKAFDMNNSGIDLSGDNVTAEHVKQQLADVICGKVWACDAPFKGNFDGNGVEIYGLRAGPAYYNQASFESGSKAGYQYGGLFGRIDTSTATIKNVKIKNSYFIGESAGAIFGYTEYTNGSVKIENCSVVNCYIESTSNNGNDAGAIGGMCRFNGTENISDKVLINNCIVYGNAIVNKTGNKNLIGVIDAWHYNGSAKVQSPEHYSIKNTIAIGCNIAKNNYWTNADSLYLNCYTTETTGTTATTVKKLSSADDAKGAAAMSNMSQLDWDNVWLFGDEGEYPTIAPRVDNENAKGTISIRSQTNESQAFVLKDPSQVNSESNPYLVETAAQMYMLMRGVAKDSNGTNISTTGNSNYFKVADGIDAFYMTSIDIGELNSAADVKAWFENSANTDFKKVWSGTPFSGHFDGNGVEIYGVRSDDSVAALFPIVAGTTTIKNVTVKNSYLKGSAGAAGIVCKTTNGNDSTVTIENCKLINCYVEAGKNGANAGAASVVGFSYGSPIIVNDVIIYGNQFVSPSGHSYGLVSYGWSSASKFTNIISIGHEPYRVTDLTTGANASYHYTKNEAFSGVYTDKIAQGAYYDASGDKTIHYFNYNESQVKQLAVSEMIGPGAVQNMPHLSWAENGGDWYAGALGDYPSFEPAGMLPSDLQAQYDSISFGAYDNYGNSTNTFGVYTTALSLKANPYISFAFAFYGDYKVNRDKIKIRFTYTENGANVTSGEVSVPAYNGEDIVNVNGWTNTAKNGRYHTYKAENIPVEALANGIKVEANYNNTGWIDFGTYSAEGLGIQFERLNRNNPCDYYETRVEAVKALLFYVQAIQSRYGAQ